MDQRTPEWFAARCGFVTASRFKDVLAKTKTGVSASRKNYLAQLVCERLTGAPAETYQNEAMRWGTEKEPEARMAYEELRGVIVEEVGFVTYSSVNGMLKEVKAGASPDGLVGDDGIVEIKCPNTATHIETLLSGNAEDYKAQIQGQLWVTGREWCDFVSYDPRLPESMRLFVARVVRDEPYITELAQEVFRFDREVTETVAKLEKKYAIPE